MIDSDGDWTKWGRFIGSCHRSCFTIIEDIRALDLPTLIQLKLAARRHQDFADIVNLIRVHNLEESYQEKLHPSLHRDNLECLDEKRRAEEYEAREG